jgi:hypothetical protein
MVHESEARSSRDLARYRVNDLLIMTAREGQVRDHHARAGSSGDEVNRLAASGVGMVGDEQFIIGLKI